MYKKIDKETVLAIREVIKSGLFKSNEETRKNLIIKLHERLCTIYKFDKVPIRYVENFPFNGRMSFTEIILGKPSLVTYLHEFKHYLDYKKGTEINEEKARGWSISAFYLSTPNLCKSAIRKGLILHQKEVLEE